MPRINNQTLYARHRLLHIIWTDLRITYSVLDIQQQWDLHSYFSPEHALTEAELQAHIRQVAAADPTLPARAGKSFKRLHQVFRTCYEQAGGSTQRFHAALRPYLNYTTSVDERGREIRVSAVANPNPDPKAIARVLISIAIRQAREAGRQGI